MPDAPRDEDSAIWRAVAKAAPYLLVNDLDEPSLFQFEHQEGWDLIVVNLAKAIHRHVSNRLETDPEAFELDYLYFTQVKEKYGRLRVYLSISDPILNAYVDFAEMMSATTCEVSGRPGSLHVREGFVKTLNPLLAREMAFSQAD